jgi:4-hydroxybutyryl-CoA dehydratase/vinylacetyl-CoA-Delta-isomerase
MKTKQEYIDSIKKMRPNIYKFGKLIEDVTTNPYTSEHVKSVARSYEYSHNPDYASIYTYKSALSGKVAHRWNTLMDSLEALRGNSDLKRHQYRQSGTCQGATCAGWTGLNALWSSTFAMDKDLGTDYNARLKKFMIDEVEAQGMALAGAITDAKGNRALRPSQQANKMSNLHLVEKRPNGIVVSGYKIQICGVAAANMIICVPGSGYGESEKDFCLAFAVPRDVEGLTIVECRTGMDRRYEEEGWDVPKSGTITQAWLLFDKVFIPNEHVFMCGEFKYSGKIIGDFAAIYRAAIGACVAGQGDVMIGAAISMARANGLSQKTFQATLNEMAINNELTYTMGIGAMTLGKKDPSGLWVPSALQAHANKVLVGRVPYDTKVKCIDIAGGISETDCFPSYADMQNAQYGKKIIEGLTAGCDGESRGKISRLITWLCNGSGIPGCMHGGGSPDGAKLVVRALTKWEDYVKCAQKIMNIPEGAIKEPEGKK